MLKHPTNDKQKEIVSELQLTQIFEDFFQSPDDFTVPVGDDGTMENELFDNVIFSLENFKKMQKTLWFEFEIVARLEHGYRHKQSIARLIEQGYNPSSTSDHLVGLGIDTHLYRKVFVNGIYANARIQDTRTLKMVAKYLWLNKKVFGIVQLGVYNNKVFRGGLHIGYNPNKRESYFERF
jgi:hypothetical protein